jgi:hypothetical protein
MIEYLFSVGLRPEIGLCVEYLSWNKEQRLYLGWLRDIYVHMYKNEKIDEIEDRTYWRLDNKSHKINV